MESRRPPVRPPELSAAGDHPRSHPGDKHVSEAHVVPATLAHADALSLRPGDAREIEAFGLTPREALARSLARSIWADAYLIGGEVAALMGLTLSTLVGGVAMPWLLTGHPVDRHRKA